MSLTGYQAALSRDKSLPNWQTFEPDQGEGFPATEKLDLARLFSNTAALNTAVISLVDLGRQLFAQLLAERLVLDQHAAAARALLGDSCTRLQRALQRLASDRHRAAEWRLVV